jgi:hypothetical protein
MRNQAIHRIVFFVAASLCLMARATDARPATWYVSPRGNDAWSGRLAEPNAAGSDGPFASLERARDAIRREKAGGALASAARVLVRGGNYYLARPFTLEPQDSGTAAAPVVYAAYPGEKPILSGGRPITGWKPGQGHLWQVEIPEVRAGTWYFHELFVNGQRRDRARLPREGYLRAVGPLVDYPHRRDPFGGNREIRMGFKFKPGDLKRSWRNLEDVNVVLYHSWTNSLHWIDTVDDAAGTVRFANPAQWPVGWWEREQRYFVDNVREALDVPGQWYLDRKTGLLEYYPLPGEDMARAACVAPVLETLVQFDGVWEENRLVHDVVLRGLCFEDADWSFPDHRQQLDGQSAEFLTAAVLARGAERLGLENCEIAHVGEYGVWLAAGCKNNRIVHCEIHDLGGGGVRVGETTRRPGKSQRRGPAPVGSATTIEGTGLRDTGHNTIDNNFIHDGGHVFAAGTGVFLGHAAYNEITHNEICDFNYSGICAGWVWGYAPSPSHHNRIADNHIHHLGWGVLSDMGGVYTLGPQPGTVVAHNLVHHVNAYSYGGWGLYTDEGSSEIVLENNVVYDTKTGGFHQHYGRDNVIRNNIFAFSREMQIVRSREDLKNSLTVEHNIVYCDNDQVLTRVWRNGDYHVDYNDYWSSAHAVPLFDGRDFDQWRASSGQDQHSVVADPRFVDAGRRDFRFQPDSPALALGFQPIALSGFGLYGEAAWVERPKQVVRGEFVLPPTAAPTPTGIDDGFENTPVGSRAENAMTRGEEQGASVRVSDAVAATGRHSLKFVDAEGMAHAWDPHIFYDKLHCLPGIARGSFDIRLGPGCLVSHEWRDAERPYHAGPSLRFEADGQLASGRTQLLRLPLDQWIHVEISCGLGPAATGSFDLSVTIPGQPPRQFTRLPLMSKDFHRLQWFGFSSNATKKVEFYVDNIKLVTGGR